LNWELHLNEPGTNDGKTGALREVLGDAIRYWEARRIAYNLVLTVAVLAWMVSTWPHFRPALTLQSLLLLVILAALANLCYCAAYLADLAMQHSPFKRLWRHRRWALWFAGMVLALVLANYWIADEVYPFVR
jgi:hypothetical protein